MHPTSAVNALNLRASVLRGIREFFWTRNFLEVETPVVLSHPSQEPYLEPLRTTVHDHRGTTHAGFLRMSPEFSLKKLLVSMRGKTSGVDQKTPDVEERMRGIFELGPVFRDGEPWGGNHNPEFTLLEWYELGADYRQLMTTCEGLVLTLVISSGAKRSREISARRRDFSTRSRGSLGRNDATLVYQGQRINLASPWERLTMREAWQRYAKLDLDEILGARGGHASPDVEERRSRGSTSGVEHARGARTTLARICSHRGYTVTRNDTFDDLFFKIHLTEVEPKLGRTKPTFLLDWPTQMAALARRKQNNPRYAERVELYIGGLELANGFSELTDADEQLARFKADQKLRRKLGKPVYPIDQDFISALRNLPKCAGMALGVDRLVMLLTNAASIEDVRWLPASRLFR